MKKIIYIVSASLLGVGFFCFPLLVFGDTTISTGQISDHEHWTKQGSPYVIEKDLSIYEGQTLTIDPGVTVKSNNAYINVSGTLYASATPQEKIIFTSASDNTNTDHDPHLFDARGLYFDETSQGSILSNVEMRYNSDGMLFSSTTASLSNIILNHNLRGITAEASNLKIDSLSASDTGYAIQLYNNSNISLASSTLENSFGSNALSSAHSTFNLLNVVIDDNNDYEPVSMLNSTGIIKNSSFNSGGQNGIDAQNSSLVVENSVITGFHNAGVIAQDGNTSISSSTIKNNSFGVIFQNKKNINLSKSSSLLNRFSELTLAIVNILKTTKVYAQSIPFQIIHSDIEQNTTFGIQNSDVLPVSAENNYWGDDSGPFNLNSNQNGKGNGVVGPVDFIPWTKHTLVPSCCSNVIFLPGVEGSRLYKKGILGENQVWEPNNGQDVSSLLLNQNGKSLNEGIYTRDIINSTNILPIFKQDIYKSFSDMMDSIVANGGIHAWKPIPYDWRLAADNVIYNGIKEETSTMSVEHEFDMLASTSKTRKVTIVAHSNGGLIAKNLINTLKAESKESLVDKVILIASPQEGTPETISALLHGDDQSLAGGLLVSQEKMRMLGVNMPSAYGLLPSNTFFTTSTPVITFDSSLDSINNFRKTYGSTISDFESMKNFLLGSEGRQQAAAQDISSPEVLNTNLFNQAIAEHRSLDAPLPLQPSQIFQIIGVGKSTTISTKYFGNNSCGLDIIFCKTSTQLDHKNIKSNNGDGIVLAQSARTNEGTDIFVNLQKFNSATDKNFSHATLLQANPVLDSVRDIVLDDTLEDSDYLSHKNFSLPVNTIALSVHSPVSIDVYDAKGNHTGLLNDKNSDTSFVEENIPNSSYSEEGEGKYVYLDSPLTSGMTTVNLQGTAVGSFTFDEEETKDGSTSLSEFADIPVTDKSKAVFMLSPSIKNGSLTVDEDGDGKIDIVIKNNQSLTPVDYLRLIKKIIPLYTLPLSLQNRLIQRIEALEKTLKKGNDQAFLKKINIFLKLLSLKQWKLTTITSAEKFSLSEMLVNIVSDLEKNDSH